MGKKSDKKVKSERINALSKRYDAFLEEDKKRKERNDYILGRLDNMRYSSTAVQIRHKPIVYGDVMPMYNSGAYRPEQFERRDFQTAHPDHQTIHPSHQNRQLDVPRNYLDNTSLLKEISKKYILIPKLRSSLVSDYVETIPPQSLPPIAVSSPTPNITGNEDWKSKYDILEQLKNNEKEEQTDKYANDELYPVKEMQIPSKDKTKDIVNLNPKQDIDGYKTQESGGYNLQSYNTKEFTTKYEQEVAEKDLTFDKGIVENEPQNIERPKISDNKYQEPTTDQAPSSSASAYTNLKTNAYDDYKSQNQSLDNYAPVEGILANNIEQNVYDSNYPNENLVGMVANDAEQNVYDSNCLNENLVGVVANDAEQNVYDSNYPNENLVASEYTTEEITNNVEHQINNAPPQEEYPIQYEQPIEVEGKFPDSENVYLDPEDYSPIQVLDPSAVVKQIPNEPVVDTEIKEDDASEYPMEMLNVQEFTPKDDVKLIDGENINPKHLASKDEKGPLNEIDSKIEAVDEHTIDPQDSSGIEAFDAEQSEMFYSEETPEYAYDQQQENAYNQDYVSTEPAEISYYESPATAMQEQEYPVEINEHEESNARYDPSYAQQYATEYEQQEYQGQEQQQYAQNEGYDQTVQEYGQTDQQQYEGYDQTQLQYQGYEYQPQDVQQVLDNEEGYVVQQQVESIKPDGQVAPAQHVADA